MIDDADPDDGETPREDDKIVREAKRRFQQTAAWEGVFRKRFVQDVQFVNGDAYNRYQWPDEIVEARDEGARPTLTVNKTRQHCLQIINDARQNKTQIRIKPVGDGADYDAAKAFEGIVRRVEYLSNADAAYLTATRFQVWGGLGYWRVVTEYVSDNSFDQEIFIRRVPDPMMIYLDPQIQTTDGSDARFGFVFRTVPKDEFRAEHGRIPSRRPMAVLDKDDDWIEVDGVRVAEYFRRVPKRDKLVAYEHDGQPVVKRLSELATLGLGRKALKALLEDPATRTRDIIDHVVEWYLIAGDEIIDRKTWPGRFIPIVRVIGEETVIKGEMDRKGHVRALIDPQRMYNYNASASVEYGALQSKSPFIGAAAAIEGYETYWESANVENYSILPFKHVDDDGNAIPPPQRAQAPSAAPAFIQGMEAAAGDMQLVSGQYQAEMGAPSNERSGVAIQARQRQGDTATYHYIDHLADAIRFTGKIIIDLAPKIYDTPRVLKILQEDGTEQHIQIDPTLPQAHVANENEREGEIVAIINPQVGDYEVQSDVGPAFATRRQEAFNALSQIARENPKLMEIIGDLVMKAADFPMSDEAAERLRRMVPAQALGEGPSPAEQQLQDQAQKQAQQVQAMQTLIQKLTDQLHDKATKLRAKEELRDIEAYDADTRRLGVMQKALPLDAEGLKQLVHQTIEEALGISLAGIDDANRPDIQGAAA